MAKQKELAVEQELSMLTNEVQKKLEDIKAIFTAFQERHPKEAKEVCFYGLAKLDGSTLESVQGTEYALGLVGFTLAEHHNQEGTRAGLDKVLRGYNAKLLAMSAMLQESGMDSLIGNLMKLKMNGSDS